MPTSSDPSDTAPALQAPSGAGPAPLPRPPRPSRVLPPVVLLFLLITWQVVTRGPLERADEWLSSALVHPGRISMLLADLGNVEVAVPVLAVVLIAVAWRAREAGADRWWLASVAAAGLMAAVPVLVVVLKALIARPGPPGSGTVTGFYPSGHTATATLAYGLAGLVLWPWLATPQARRRLLDVCVAVILGVVYGLIRSGYHWPLDTLASWCLCAPALYALWSLLSRRADERHPSAPATEPATGTGTGTGTG
ncbi:phosphatase PAP2 family protein [Streptomyces sp. NPDC048664]|uniref:phosphatase PAP2 family protein n=1 Tax=Streptomyces sp. NPDC048664 TaxID=3154505 RepID=UPI0034419D72